MNKLILLTPLLLLVMIGIAGATTPSAFPSGIQYYVPINLTNSQTTATPANFQQMLTFNALAICTAKLCAPHLNNTEFFYVNGTVMPSWYESGAGISNNYGSNDLASSSNVIAWVKLSPAGFVPASGTNTIYIGFASNSTNLFSNTITGEAPQLSSTYAEYDDGANVFSFYANFAGTTLPTGWTVLSTGTTFNNGAIVGPTDFLETTSKYPIAYSNILEGYISSITYGTSGDNAGFAYTVDVNGNDYTVTSAYLTLGTGAGEVYNGQVDFFSTTTDLSMVTSNGGAGSAHASPIADSTGVWSLWTTSTTGYLSVNYGTATTVTTNIPPAGDYYILTGSSANGPTVTYNWFRTRAYPPAGIMPSVSFGAVVCISPTLAISPNPSTYGQATTLTATAVCSSADNVAIDYPTLGTAIATGTGSATYTYNPFSLGAGCGYGYALAVGCWVGGYG